MSSIFPEISSGGEVVRDLSGLCLSPVGVSQAYCPPATFVNTCEITALPDNCNTRITAAQINAFQSEMLALAECFQPTGTWNCSSLTNLCTAFTAWVEGAAATDLAGLIESILCDVPAGVYDP